MKIFKDDKIPSCSDCDYADNYIPYYTYPFSEPYCSKGHGKCEVDKLCGDFKPITATCVRCEFIRFNNKIKKFICIKRYSPILFTGINCVNAYRKQKFIISNNSKTCDEFQWRNGELKEHK